MTWWNSLPDATPMDAALSQEGVSGPLADLARSVYHQESSSGKNTKTSNAGAVGGMQIIPSTFSSVADKGWDINDPIQNARAGIRYLKQMQDLGGGDPRMAAVGYYGGPGAIKAAKAGKARRDPRNPNAPDTFQYADQVTSRLPQNSPGLLERAASAIIPAAQAEEVPQGNWWDSLPDADGIEAQSSPASQENWWSSLPDAEMAATGDPMTINMAHDEPATFDQQIRASAPGRFLQGASDLVTGGAQMLVNSLPETLVDTVNSGVQAINDLPVIGPVTEAIGIRPATADQMNQRVAQDEQRYQEARRATGQEGMDWWRLAGNVAGTLPMSGAAPAAATGLGRVAVGAGQGALFGGLQPVTEGPYAENKLFQMGTGAAAGGAVAGVGNALARLVSPRASTNPQVQTLLDEGVVPTPGQIMGGTARQVEDKAMSVPILGDAIRSARNRGIEELNEAALNRVVKPLGQTVNATGREGVRQANSIISQAYDDVLPRVTFRADGQFARELGQLQQMAASMPPAQAQQFENIVRTQVGSRLTPQGVATGRNFKDIESELGRLAQDYLHSGAAGERQLGTALSELQRSMREALQRTNPDVASELGRINQSYAMLTRIQRAAGGSGATDGVFTPAQLSSAVRASDRTARKGAFARGDALMQDLSDAAKGVMQGTVPNSGTADRLLLSGGAALVSPMSALGLGAASTPYLPAINRLAAAALARRPQFAPRVAEAISQGLVPAPFVAAPLANQMLNQ